MLRILGAICTQLALVYASPVDTVAKSEGT